MATSHPRLVAQALLAAWPTPLQLLAIRCRANACVVGTTTTPPVGVPPRDLPADDELPEPDLKAICRAYRREYLRIVRRHRAS